MADDLIRKVSKNKKPLTIPVEGQYKDLYDRLSSSGISAAEHLRRVIYPELDRLKKLAEAEAS